MTHLPDDLIDPLETRLMRRVRAYSEPALLPIDPVAIAAAASLARRPASPLARFGNRLVLVGAGALLAIAALGGIVGSGALNGPSATQTAIASGPPTCDFDYLDGEIVRWEGAAGSRIASVMLSRFSTDPEAGDCALPDETQLALVDGSRHDLIVGPYMREHVVIERGEILSTMVRVSNYCGPVPMEPVTISMRDQTGMAMFFTPADGISGVPPCNGVQGPRNDISRLPWAVGPATD